MASTARIAMSGNEIVGSAVPPTGGTVPASVGWPPDTCGRHGQRRRPRAGGGSRTVGIERASVGLVERAVTVGLVERAVVRLIERAVGLVERAVRFGVTIVGLWAGRAVARCVGGAALGGRLSRIRRGVAAAAGRLTL